MRDHLEVGPTQRRTQIGDRGAAAQSIARRALEIADAFLTLSVEIAIAPDAGRLAGFDERVGERMPVLDVRYRQRTADAMPVIRAARLVFRFLEIRQAVRVPPARIAEIAPVVEVFALAANIEQAVDRARAAKHAPAWHLDVAPIHARLGLGLEHPVHFAIEHHLAEADRNVDPAIRVATSRLEQQHGVLS